MADYEFIQNADEIFRISPSSLTKENFNFLKMCICEDMPSYRRPSHIFFFMIQNLRDDYIILIYCQYNLYISCTIIKQSNISLILIEMKTSCNLVNTQQSYHNCCICDCQSENQPLLNLSLLKFITFHKRHKQLKLYKYIPHIIIVDICTSV